MGDDAYKFEELLPYFQKSYNFTPPNNDERLQNSSVTGDNSDWINSNEAALDIGYPSWVNPISSWLGLAFEELGIPYLSSLSSGNLLGWSWISQTIDPITQVRSSSQEFLWDAFMEDSNLLMYKSTLAKKIIFEGTTATGVTVDSGGLEYDIMARNEVILSGGVVSDQFHEHPLESF